MFHFSDLFVLRLLWAPLALCWIFPLSEFWYSYPLFSTIRFPMTFSLFLVFIVVVLHSFEHPSISDDIFPFPCSHIFYPICAELFSFSDVYAFYILWSSPSWFESFPLLNILVPFHIILGCSDFCYNLNYFRFFLVSSFLLRTRWFLLKFLPFWFLLILATFPAPFDISTHFNIFWFYYFFLIVIDPMTSAGNFAFSDSCSSLSFLSALWFVMKFSLCLIFVVLGFPCDTCQMLLKFDYRNFRWHDFF